MKLRERQFEHKTCRLCGHKDSKLIVEESYGCDGCKQPIDDLINANSKNNKYCEYLELRIFTENTNSDSKSLSFCSWKCMFKKLKTIKCNHFIVLPYITYGKTMPGQTVKDFLDCIKK